jgi:hypothetical protein
VQSNQFTGENKMARISEVVDARYEALLFAKSAADARSAASALIEVVLGDEAVDCSLERGLRQCCQMLRPADDPKEQVRYENEFIELGIWPQTSPKQIVVAPSANAKPEEQKMKQQAA